VQHVIQTRIALSFDGQFASRITQPVDRQHRRRAGPRNIGKFLIQMSRKKLIQRQTLPKLQPQIAVAKPAASVLREAFSPERRATLGSSGSSVSFRNTFNCVCLSLYAEDLDGLLPASLSRTVQLTQIADGPLSWTIRCADSLHQ
jgi:hypothetical protein